MPGARYVHAAIDSCCIRFSHLQQNPYIANIYNEHQIFDAINLKIKKNIKKLIHKPNVKIIHPISIYIYIYIKVVAQNLYIFGYPYYENKYFNQITFFEMIEPIKFISAFFSQHNVHQNDSCGRRRSNGSSLYMMNQAH